MGRACPSSAAAKGEKGRLCLQRMCGYKEKNSTQEPMLKWGGTPSQKKKKRNWKKKEPKKDKPKTRAAVKERKKTKRDNPGMVKRNATGKEGGLISQTKSSIITNENRHTGVSKR